MTLEPAPTTPAEGEAGKGIPYGLMLWVVCLVPWATWAPFFVRGWVPRVEFTLPDSAVDVLGNLMLCAPVAILLAATVRGGGKYRRLLAATLPAAAVSVIAEAGQLLLVERTASPYDILLNTAGAAFFAALTLRLLEGGMSRRGIVVGTAVTTLLLLGAFLALEAVRIERGLRIAGWDQRYSVVVGDEGDSSRPYEGSIEEARLCAGEESQRFCLRGGASRDERSRFIQVAERSQQVSAFSTVRSASDLQWGPTRIITFSINPRRRNITMAQEATSLAFRIRTPVTGPNGSDPQFFLPHVIHAGQLTELAATFDRGHVTLRAQSSERESVVHYRFGLLTSWLTRIPNRILEPPHFTWARPATAVVLFLGLGLVLGIVYRRLPIVPLGSLAVTSAAAICLADGGLLGGACGIPELALAGALAALGAGLSLHDRHSV